MTRNRAKRKLRALFYEHSQNLKDGTYIFVAKAGLLSASHSQVSNDFVKVLKRMKSFKEIPHD